MQKLSKLFHRPVVIGMLLFFASLCYYAHAAVNFPLLFNLDNHYNHAATRYIAENGRLPVVKADDSELVFTSLGTTRSLRPPFTYIVTAMVSRATEALVDKRVTRQRLGSALMGALTVIIIFIGFYTAFNSAALALLGASIIGLLPKFVFLASCNNDDIGAILSASLLFTSVLVLQKKHSQTWVLLLLAASFGFVLQTKFTAWLLLPWLGLYCAYVLKIHRPCFKAVSVSALLLLVALLAGGWWIVFNMVNYGLNDPTAMTYAAELQSQLNPIVPNQQGYASAGIGIIELLSNYDRFLSKSYTSLIGYLQWLELDLGLAIYLFYAFIFVAGFAGIAIRSSNSHSLKQSVGSGHSIGSRQSTSSRQSQTYFDLLIVAMIVAQCAFYIHHNLVRDIQPQARYLLPVFMPLVYLFLRALNKLPIGFVRLTVGDLNLGFQRLLIAALLLMCLGLHVNVRANYIDPIYQQQPFYTNLSQAKELDLEQHLNILSNSGLSYRFEEGGLVLQRAGNGTAMVELDPKFCQHLHVNTLLSFDVQSPSNGGLSLWLDDQPSGHYENKVWQGFAAGDSTVLFSLKTNGCSGVRIALSKRTNRVTLSKLKIRRLKIHKHGKPI